MGKRKKKGKKGSKVEEKVMEGGVSEVEVGEGGVIEGHFIGDIIIAEQNPVSKELYEKGVYGELVGENKYQYSLVEGLFLMEKGRMKVFFGKKELDHMGYIKKASKMEPTFWIRFCVFRDLRRRGYIVKSALKFGADFMVYDRGVRPGEDHAKWIVYPVPEGESLTWFEFAAKNRVAHSTRKRLLLAIVDARDSVTYYEVAWKRP